VKRLAMAALVAVCATPSLAVPMCYTPKSGNVIVLEFEVGKFSETERAQWYEQRLRMMGIDARQTTFWNGCVQTDVRENGKLKMRFYDPWTLEEVPLD
jgi:hypothetical protein